MFKIQRHIIFILIFLCTSYGSYSQSNNLNKIDSIKKSFNEVSGKQQIERIAQFIRFSNFHQDFDYKPFEPFINNLYEWEKQTSDLSLYNTIRLGHVNLLIAKGDSKEAFQKLQEIIQNGPELTPKDGLSTYTFLFNLYLHFGLYEEAWETTKKRGDIIFSKSNTEEDSFFKNFIKIHYNELAYAYLKTKRYKQAIETYTTVLNLATKEKDYHYISGTHNNLGLVYLELNKPQKAYSHFIKTLDNWKLYLNSRKDNKLTDSSFSILVQGNIGQTYLQNKRYNKAIPLLNAEANLHKKENRKTAYINSLSLLSNAYIGIKDYQTAFDLLDEIDSIYNQSSSLYINPAIENRIKIYEVLGNYKLSYTYLKKFKTLTDSIVKAQTSNKVTIMEISYKVAQKNNEIAKQKSQIQAAQNELDDEKRRKQLFFVFVLLMSVIIIALIVIGFQKRKRTQELKEKNTQIETQNNIIKKALTEKESLLKEVHHRVKNNLQLISGILELQAAQSNDKSIKKTMYEGQKRLQSMSLIHQKLYEQNDLGNINFKDYLMALIKDINAAFNTTKQSIICNVKADDVYLDIHIAVPLGLIVNELVTNSFKHAFNDLSNGEVNISLIQKSKKNYEISVKDNGTGLADVKELPKKHSLGFRLIEGLIRQIGGTYHFKTDNGFHFYINFETKA
jgi:two-component sensor histidine kinase